MSHTNRITNLTVWIVTTRTEDVRAYLTQEEAALFARLYAKRWQVKCWAEPRAATIRFPSAPQDVPQCA